MTDPPARPEFDEIRICDLKFRCIVGVNEDERHREQEIVAQITLYTDLRQAGATDAIDDTVDYKALKQDILALAARSRFYLIEALAEAIAEVCLQRPRVERVAVVVEKPGALRFARTVAVRIVRGRKGHDE